RNPHAHRKGPRPARGRAGGPYRRQAVWGAQQVADPRSRGPWRRRGPYPPAAPPPDAAELDATSPVLVNNGHDPFFSPREVGSCHSCCPFSVYATETP